MNLIKLSLLVAIGFFHMCGAVTAYAQDKVTISGYVKDAADGESLIGATVLIKELGDGGITNVYGFYSITVPAGDYNVVYSYVGYKTQSKTISLTSDQRVDMELGGDSQELEEVVVTAEAEDANVASVEMSTNKLDIKTIEKLPALLGEVDVIKGIQFLPGVSTVGEGAAGFNVRGGGVGQNLILLDEAPVYNSSHLFGFFSVFNPDAVKDTKLFKGAIPSRYGGRLASILDVRMKEGNSKEYDINGGVGLIFSRLAVEGPIAKDKASFIVAARRSYADILAGNAIEVLENGGALNYYDITAKTNWQVNDKNRVFLSGYLGRDVFRFDENQGFNWGNATGTLRWNRVFNSRLFANFTGVFSRYDYELEFGDNPSDQFLWNSSISNFMFKPEFTYYLDRKNEITFGGEAIYYTFEPANAEVSSSNERSNISLDERYNLESAVYIGNKQDINSTFSIEYGLRFSRFWAFGPGKVFEYAEGTPGERRDTISSTTFSRGEAITSFDNLEPRFGFKAQLNPKSSIKGSYNRMAQYLHLVSNTTASNPLDVWTPSSPNLKPQIGDQYTLGYFRNIGEANDYEVSVEGYLKFNQNQVDYIDGANLLINEQLEGDLLVGDGRAYGVEFYVKKNTGKFNGWASYTLGRTELQVEGINNNEWYPTRFDQLHNLKLAGFYNISDRISFSGNFTWVSGTPATFPTSRYLQQGIVIPHNTNESRNNVRISDFHRLDLSLRIDGKKFRNGKRRKNTDYLIISVYNVYGRRNPFSVYFAQNTDSRPEPGTPIASQATQLAIIGIPVPAISYNFSF